MPDNWNLSETFLTGDIAKCDCQPPVRRHAQTANRRFAKSVGQPGSDHFRYLACACDCGRQGQCEFRQVLPVKYGFGTDCPSICSTGARRTLLSSDFGQSLLGSSRIQIGKEAGERLWIFHQRSKFRRWNYGHRFKHWTDEPKYQMMPKQQTDASRRGIRCLR